LESDASSSEEERERKRAKKKAASTKKAARGPKPRRNGSNRSSSTLTGASSDLDPVTPSEGSDSELSSADEDYFATPKKAEGAPVVERNVAANGEGSMAVLTAEKIVLENRKAYVDCAFSLSFFFFADRAGCAS